MFKSIIVFNPFGIGDVLFSMPLVKVLNKNFPDAKIYYISNKRVYSILRNMPYLENVIIFEKDRFRHLAKKSKIKFLKEFIAFLRKIKSCRAGLMVDLSLNYQASLAGKLLNIPKRIGFNYRSRGKFLTDKLELEGFEKKHVVLYYLDLLKLINVEAQKENFTEVVTSREGDEWSDLFIKENHFAGKFIIGLTPGGGRSWGVDARYRRWPVSNFAHVADRLIDTFNVSIILFGDKEEAPLCNNVESFMHSKVVNMGGKTNIAQFMSLLKKCRLFLCNEGGPLHIAVALGVPTVSIFGPVDEKIYGPYAKDTQSNIVVSEREKCSPCYSKFKHTKCATIKCLESISEYKVFDAVKTLISKLESDEKNAGNLR